MLFGEITQWLAAGKAVWAGQQERTAPELVCGQARASAGNAKQRVVKVHKNACSMCQSGNKERRPLL